MADPRLDRTGLHLVLDDRFDGPLADHWVPHHLPQWSSRAASAARYDVGTQGLVLRVDADQQPWCPELDGHTRVSSLQTGVRAGDLGSAVGQHRFHADAVVREEQVQHRGFTPHHGLMELRARACPDPDAMVALWMIGFEDEPWQSAEICVAEIFGHRVQPTTAGVGMGVHPFGDPAITDDFAVETLAMDAREAHTYSALWTQHDVSFFVDEVLVKVVGQSPDYPMQLMLGIYDFTPPDRVDATTYPKRFAVDWVRGWSSSA